MQLGIWNPNSCWFIGVEVPTTTWKGICIFQRHIQMNWNVELRIGTNRPFQTLNETQSKDPTWNFLFAGHFWWRSLETTQVLHYSTLLTLFQSRFWNEKKMQLKSKTRSSLGKRFETDPCMMARNKHFHLVLWPNSNDPMQRPLRIFSYYHTWACFESLHMDLDILMAGSY